jgi:hypothetical protein
MVGWTEEVLLDRDRIPIVPGFAKGSSEDPPGLKPLNDMADI